MAKKHGFRDAVPLVPGAVDAAVGVRQVVVVRESDAANKLLFSEMTRKTMLAFRDQVPALNRLVDMGAEPFERPDAYSALVVGGRSTRTALFMADGETLVMLHMGSAAMDDESSLSGVVPVDGRGAESSTVGKNRFTSQLIEVLERHRPDTLFVYGVNRLVRDFSHASRLQIALKQFGVSVRDRDREYRLDDPQHVLVWQLLTSFAAAERDGIVDRNMIGRIAQARRGEWPYGAVQAPFGYSRDGATIRPVEALIPKVRRVLELLADPTLTNAEFVDAAAEVGVKRERLRQLHGEDGRVDLAVHPKDVRKSFMNWLGLYETGVHRVHVRCPLTNADMYGGLPVWVDERSDDGQRVPMITLAYDFGVPDGGWAPPSLFEAIRTRTGDDSAFHNVVPRGRRRPFGGRDPYRSDDETTWYQIYSSNDVYRLATVDITTINTTRSDIDDTSTVHQNTMRDRVPVATFRTDEFHRSVIDGVIDAIHDTVGVDGHVTAASYVPMVDEHDQQEHILNARISRLTDEARRAAENAARVEHPTARQPFIDIAKELAEQIELAERELAEVRTRTQLDTEPRTVISRSDMIGVLATVARATGSVDGPTADALATILSKLELHPTPRTAAFEWRACVRIPLTDDRILELGPITGTITARNTARGTNIEQVTPVVEQTVRQWARGCTVNDIAAARGTKRDLTHTTLRKYLAKRGFDRTAISALMHSTPPELRQLVVTAANEQLLDLINTEHPDREQLATHLDHLGLVPAGCDPHWAAHTLLSYTPPFPIGDVPKWRRDHRLVTTGYDAIADERSTLDEIAAHIYKQTKRRLRNREIVHLLDTQPCPLERVEPWNLLTFGEIAPDNRYRIRTCPRCEYQLVYINTLETPEGMICPACHTTPSPTSPTFPTSYANPPSTIPVETDQVHKQRRTTTISPELTRAVIDAYQNNEPALDIVRRHDITTFIMYKIIDDNDIPRRHPPRKRNRTN